MGRYAEILRTPRVGWLLAATTLGRIPFAVNALAVLLLIRETTGSFALAGAAVGALTLGAGLGAPIAARLIDRRGSPTLVVLAIVHAAGVLVLVALALGGAPDPPLVIASALIGSSYPPSGSVLRARWPQLLGNDPGLVRSAYALDSVVIEISFVSGPLLTAGIVALAGPEVALLCSAGLVVVGTALFVSLLPGPDRPAEPHGLGALGALAAPAIRVIALTTVPVGFCIGTIEVALPAFSHASGRDELSGVLLALWSAASGVGGLIFGARAIRGQITATYLRIALLFPLACLPLAMAGTPLAMAGLVVLAGLPIAPLISSRNELMAEVAPAGAATEAFTWLTTALVAGLSAGAAVAGVLVESRGWSSAVLAGVTIAALGGVLAVARRRALIPTAVVHSPAEAG